MSGLGFLAVAYTAIWVAFFFYLMSLGRRARRLEQEIETLRAAKER